MDLLLQCICEVKLSSTHLFFIISFIISPENLFCMSNVSEKLCMDEILPVQEVHRSVFTT